ncbi:schlafen family member 9 isoform X1 [Caretta caretta]|uniref:schlafen family member 9 isoform X1 n=2 Tax=Caretta caretta TaxID=8467 RepID=UPI003F4B53AF
MCPLPCIMISPATDPPRDFQPASPRNRMATEEKHPCVDLNTKYPDVVVKVGKVIFGETYRKEKNKQHIKKKQKENISQAACALLNSGGGLIEAEIENEGYNEGDGLGKDIEDSFTELIPSQMFADYFESIKQNSKLLIFVKSWRIEVSSSSDISSSSRICSQKTGLYQRCGTSVKLMNSSVAAQFFKRKKECSRRRSDETQQGAERAVLNGFEEEHDSIENIFNVQHLTHGEKLNFSESTRVDYKEFASADNLNIIQKDIEDKLPKYISAFANTQGGYLFFGVDDERKVVGCRKENVTANQLLRIVKSGRQKVRHVFHFCSSRPELIVVPKILNVRDNQGNLYGYVCAVKIKPFCCAVFLHNPDSWIVKDDRFERLMAKDWMDLMTTPDPEISNLAEVLKTVLSLSGASPLSKPVFSNKGLTCLSDLRKALFPVYSNKIIYIPENLTEGLFSEYPGLENLMNEQMEELQASQGLLIFSRSWAVDIGLQENQQVVCDALLIAAGKHPMLYTVTQKDCSANMFENARQTARALKQKLVNVGGYTQRVCVIPHLLQLGTNEEGNTELGLQVKYPASYTVSQKDIRKLLDSLVIILLGFRSFLSDRLGCEFFNLLTIKQYEILSKDLHKCRKLFIYGLPGTGKTIVALKIIEKIRHMFRCQSDEILYICENAPLKTFVSEKGICQSVTRVTFMKSNFEKVKHIVVDEAQNFREEDGCWYRKAECITQSHNEPGVFWIFLDYLQTSHPFVSGLPPARQHDPVESLTQVVRNSTDIYDIIKKQMEKIVQDKKLGDVPYERLKNLLSEATCGHDVSGDYTIKRNLNMNEIANYVARQCFSYLQKGYSEKEIAILFSTNDDKKKYEHELKIGMRKYRLNPVFQEADEIQGKRIILDSIRRFSGLERSIVFGVNPVSTQDKISDNLLLCVASRANLHLHLLFEKIPSGYSGVV